MRNKQKQKRKKKKGDLEEGRRRTGPVAYKEDHADE